MKYIAIFYCEKYKRKDQVNEIRRCARYIYDKEDFRLYLYNGYNKEIISNVEDVIELKGE